MYAVIESGGKQYKVSEGAVIRVEKLPGETGGTVEFDRVLAVGNSEKISVGTPVLENASVTAEVLSHGRGGKIIAYKFKRRKDTDRKVGHRQDYTELKIKEINGL